MSERFRREYRLLRRVDFQYVARHGRHAYSGGFVVAAVARDEALEQREVRLGITVGRRVGNAVVRNQLKRWVREWFRRRRVEMQPALDMVVIARRSAGQCSHEDVVGALDAGVRAVGLLA